MPRFLGFIGPSYTSRSKNVDAQRCVNLYPELNELGTGKEREVAALYSTPGLRLLTTAGTGVHRGSWVASNGSYFAVHGNKLFRFNSSMVATQIGTLNSTVGKVSMADNGLQLVVVDGPDGYIHQLVSNTLEEITDEDWMGASRVLYSDGYFIFIKPDSEQFYISELRGTDVDALDIATSEGQPDKLVSAAIMNRDLWLFNEISTEIFSNTGNADFPFERVSGGYIEYGCEAVHSVAQGTNTVYWLGRSREGRGLVFMASGSQPQRISTHAIETAIKSYGDVSDASAYTYLEEGHFFYVLNFPTANTTWVFDATTKMWHERAFNNDGVFERHRADSHGFAYNMHIVGDYASNKIYALDPDYYTDNGTPIIRLRTTPHVSQGGKSSIYSLFELDAEAGVGLDGVGQGTDPMVMFSYSDDSGRTWSQERMAQLGKIGERKKRIRFQKLGRSRDRIYKIAVSDPVPVVLLGAELEFETAAA